ncbi:MAG: class I SAM-dependent methyltransferase [Myxococcaceae bacterium]
MFHPEGPTFFELISQGLSSTDRGYDRLASKFERTPFRTPDAVLQAAAERVGGPVELALDLGCGTGAALRAFRPRCQALVGVDRSAGMLAEARRLLPNDPGQPPVHLVRGDALELPFAARFDLVTCFGAFGHILERDEPRLVAQLARVLRPGGRFVFATSAGPSPRRPGWWLAHGFNALMRVRNALIKPEFIMYYLTFLLPRARALLEAGGFEVQVKEGAVPPPYQRLALVIASRRG